LLGGEPPAAPQVPAALGNQSAPILDEAMPPALAKDDDYVVRIVVGSVTCSGALIKKTACSPRITAWARVIVTATR